VDIVDISVSAMLRYLTLITLTVAHPMTVPTTALLSNNNILFCALYAVSEFRGVIHIGTRQNGLHTRVLFEIMKVKLPYRVAGELSVQ
jgi:hypothetical protein